MLYRINNLSMLVGITIFTSELFLSNRAQASVIYTSRTSTSSITCNNFSLGNSNCTPQTLTSTDMNPYSASLSGGGAEAKQQSQIIGNSISINITASGNSGSGKGHASSSFLLNFTLDSDTLFSIVGSTGAYPSSSGVSASVTLTGPSPAFGVADYSCRTDSSGNSCTINNTYGYGSPYSVTTLGAGSYALYVAADSGSPSLTRPTSLATSNITLSFSPAPVPIPATIWLLSSGLAMFRPVLRRKKAA